MKFNVRLAFCVVFAGGVLFITGCASSPTAPSRASSANRNATQVTPVEPPVYVTPHPSQTVAFSTSDTDTLPTPAPTAHNSRQAMLIGLYGELTDNAGNAGGVFDGGSNLGQITTAVEGACVDPDVDRTGTWLAFASTMHSSTSDIYLKAVNGKTVTQLTTDPADDVMPAFSPDGKTIAFASNRSGNWDIYTVSVDGNRTVQITSDTDHELHPSWSPDGRFIAYGKFGTQSGRWEMWLVDASNPGVRHFLDYGVFPQWCPDPARSKILFQRAKQRGSRDYSIWTIDVINGQAMHPTEIVSAANAALINPAWSPDGSRIVFVSVVDPHEQPQTKPAQSDLWVVNIDGTGRTSLTNGQFANFQPVWASDGTVYFVSDRSGVDNVWAVKAMHAIDTPPAQGTGFAGASTNHLESHP